MKRRRLYYDERCIHTFKETNAGDTTFESIGIQSLSQLNNNNRVVTKQEFIDYYILLLPYCSSGQEVERVELGIAGTPAELNVSEWEMYTTKGKYIFDLNNCNTLYRQEGIGNSKG